METSTTYSRVEKLKQKKELGLLFEKGKWKTHHYLRVVFYENKLENPEQGKFGVCVSKRYFKKAVDRNRIKRLLRECYRLNKDLYTASFGETTLTMLFWISKELPKKQEDVLVEFKKICEKVAKTRTASTSV
ncbi:ribonuclease P protein component [Amniculibacterium sp. G2-70]|uniref:ribonuclease P protein component n=1 Tax=Amniculibacterium sp. G2-70 TaxID=2767188 RepID=UPI001654075D|nr:ribonuclease P protein component [Amniculibacterium sp. G2-70]